jgi:hypothetical protein
MAIDDYSKAASRRLEDAARAHFFKHDNTTWHSATAYAGYSSSSVFPDALNVHLFIQSSVCHLPLYRMDNAKELNEFVQRFPELQFDRGFAEVPSFRTVTAGCDDAFFAENVLLVAYVLAENPDDRYWAESISTSNPLTIHVAHLPADDTSASVMSGWWIITAVPQTYVDGAFMLDAVLKQDDSAASVPLPEIEAPSTVKNNRAVVTRVTEAGIIVRPDPYMHTNDQAYMSTEYFFATEDAHTLVAGDAVMIVHTGEFQWSDNKNFPPIGKLLAIGKVG